MHTDTKLCPVYSRTLWELTSFTDFRSKCRKISFAGGLDKIMPKTKDLKIQLVYSYCTDYRQFSLPFLSTFGGLTPSCFLINIFIRSFHPAEKVFCINSCCLLSIGPQNTASMNKEEALDSGRLHNMVLLLSGKSRKGNLKLSSFTPMCLLSVFLKAHSKGPSHWVI